TTIRWHPDRGGRAVGPPTGLSVGGAARTRSDPAPAGVSPVDPEVHSYLHGVRGPVARGLSGTRCGRGGKEGPGRGPHRGRSEGGRHGRIRPPGRGGRRECARSFRDDGPDVG